MSTLATFDKLITKHKNPDNFKEYGDLGVALYHDGKKPICDLKKVLYIVAPMPFGIDISKKKEYPDALVTQMILMVAWESWGFALYKGKEFYDEILVGRNNLGQDKEWYGKL